MARSTAGNDPSDNHLPPRYAVVVRALLTRVAAFDACLGLGGGPAASAVTPPSRPWSRQSRARVPAAPPRTRRDLRGHLFGFAQHRWERVAALDRAAEHLCGGRVGDELARAAVRPPPHHVETGVAAVMFTSGADPAPWARSSRFSDPQPEEHPFSASLLAPSSPGNFMPRRRSSCTVDDKVSDS